MNLDEEIKSGISLSGLYSIEEANPSNFMDLFKNFTRRSIIGDGNCFFRSVLIALGLDESSHMELRKIACDFMLENKELFLTFGELMSEEDFIKLANSFRLDHAWASSEIIYCKSLILNVTVYVYVPGNAKPLIFNDLENKEKISIINTNFNHFDAHLPRINNNLKRSKIV